MAERSLRGMSIGAKSLESDDNVDFAARSEVAYICPKGHRTILPFAEAPKSPTSGNAAAAPSRTARRRRRGGQRDRQATRTHWDMLLERRSEDELKKLLDKRLECTQRLDSRLRVRGEACLSISHDPAAQERGAARP